MTEDDWNQHRETCVGVFLNGQTIIARARGERIEDDSFLLLINASPEAASGRSAGRGASGGRS